MIDGGPVHSKDLGRTPRPADPAARLFQDLLDIAALHFIESRVIRKEMTRLGIKRREQGSQPG